MTSARCTYQIEDVCLPYRRSVMAAKRQARRKKGTETAAEAPVEAGGAGRRATSLQFAAAPPAMIESSATGSSEKYLDGQARNAERGKDEAAEREAEIGRRSEPMNQRDRRAERNESVQRAKKKVGGRKRKIMISPEVSFRAK